MLTPETLTRHELVGLPVRVVDAANPDLIGISGRVVDETMQTLVVRDASRERQIPKRDSILEFRLDVEPALDVADTAGNSTAGDDNERSDVDTHTSIDEAASSREAAGDASKREEDTAGVRPGQSPSTSDGSARAGKPPREDCEAAVYVTVDGQRLLSRPALRTEHAGDTKWQSD
jgi:ribonuclease P protein subunit POP4